VQVISRAAEILRVLPDSPAGLTLAEVARRVTLPRPTVHHIVGTLENEGFVVELFPAYCTANRKALLATLSEAALETVLPRRLPG
jgi:DNA-binding IclR family transcriptional regulator